MSHRIVFGNRSFLLLVLHLKEIDDMSPRILLLALHLQYNGNWDKVYNAILKRMKPHKRFITKAQKVHRKYLTILDKDYPQHLKTQYRPPFVIPGYFYVEDLL